MKPSRRFVLLVLVAAFAARAGAQSPAAQESTTLESYRAAQRIIDRALAAHGSLDVFNKTRVRLEGTDFHRGQSRRVAQPYDSSRRVLELHFDIDRGQLVAEQSFEFPGGIRRWFRFVSDSAADYYVNLRNEVFELRDYPPAREQYGNLFYLPQGYLRLVAGGASPGLRRYLGRKRLPSGAVVDAITVPFPPSSQLTLGFDPATGLLRSVMSVVPDLLQGEVEAFVEFTDYRPLGGVLMPSRMVSGRGQDIDRSLRYVAMTTNTPVPPALLAPLPTHERMVADPDTLKTLAPGVWAVRGGGAWSLLIEFADHLMVVDAPPGAAEAVLAQARALAPGKAVRYVVPTHHHSDHFGAVRQYAAAGVTTVTTPGNADYFRQLVSARPSALMAATPATPNAALEFVQGRRVFTDGTRTVEIHDIGPSPHVNEFLVAWLPREGIVFQADVIEAVNGVPRAGHSSPTSVHFGEFIARQRWNVRVFAGAHDFLSGPDQFARLMQLPIVPQVQQ